MARPRVEDSTMLGGVSSQKMDASFDALSARLMRHEHFSRVYHAGSPGAPPRGDPMRNFRSETAVGIVDGQPYGAANRVHFLPSSDGDFSSGNSGMLGSVDRNEGLVDESRRLVNGNSHVSGVKNTSPRVPVWAGSQQPGETGSGVDFRDMEERDEGSSGGSQSDGSEEDEEEEDGNMDGEGEDGESHQGVVDRRLPGQKGYETLSNIQIDGMEGDSHELMAGLQTSEGFQKTKFDREISSKASTSSAPSLGMFLSPSSTIPFMNSFASPPSVAPMLGHAEGNSAAPNDMIVVASGLGTSPGYYRDDITKEITVTDTYVKENQNFNHEQGRIVHSSQVPEAVPIEAATAEHYSSLVQAIAVIPPQKDPGNQIVAFSHGKNPEAMEMQLRSALTDPLTGALMDDATILLCGHSFGSESLQRVLENNACISCGAAAKREDMAPNHALRSVILAYKREEQRWKENASKSAKRRRERLEQVRQNSGDLTPFESSRHKGVQFPYKVNDRVLIKGNKRTPERFVGRNAVITTQCLNGWYVVRTLDNGESVKLQYRSLMKVDEQPSSTKELQSKITGPNWL